MKTKWEDMKTFICKLKVTSGSAVVAQALFFLTGASGALMSSSVLKAWVWGCSPIRLRSPPATFKPSLSVKRRQGAVTPTLVNPHLSSRPRKQQRIATCSLPALCEIKLLWEAWAGQSHWNSYGTRLEYLTISPLKCFFLLMQSDVWWSDFSFQSIPSISGCMIKAEEGNNPLWVFFLFLAEIRLLSGCSWLMDSSIFAVFWVFFFSVLFLLLLLRFCVSVIIIILLQRIFT